MRCIEAKSSNKTLKRNLFAPSDNQNQAKYGDETLEYFFS